MKEIAILFDWYNTYFLVAVFFGLVKDNKWVEELCS